MTFPSTQISSPPQASAEIIVNEAFETIEHQSVYGKKHATSSGLTWGYYGGRWSGFSVADGPIALSAAAGSPLADTDNYLVVDRATGALSKSTSTTNWNDTQNYARVYKISASSTAITVVEDHRCGLNGIHGVKADPPIAAVKAEVGVACSDETTALTAGVAKVTFRMPFALTLTAVRASLTTPQASGSIFTVDINETTAGSPDKISILSTKLTIDNNERTSTTAATAAVISDASLADDAEITIDIDQIGNGTAKGLKVWLIGTRA